MIKKKGKTVSFDAMVRFFIQYYDLPTKTDIEKLNERMDRLEILMQEIAAGSSSAGGARRLPSRRALKPRAVVTAADDQSAGQ